MSGAVVMTCCNTRYEGVTETLNHTCPIGTRTFAVDAAGSPIEECPTTVRAIVGSETGDNNPHCSWCDNLAEYAVTEDHLDFVEIACQYHRERYWITPVSLIKRSS